MNDDHPHPKNAPLNVGVSDCTASPTNMIENFLAECPPTLDTVPIVVEHPVANNNEKAPAPPIDTISHVDVPVTALNCTD